MHDRRSQGFTVSVNVFIPEYRAPLCANTGQKKFQIARFFETGVSHRSGRGPPQDLTSSVCILNDECTLCVPIEMIGRHEALPARLGSHGDLRSRGGDLRRSKGRGSFPRSAAKDFGYRAVLREKYTGKHSGRDNTPSLGNKLFKTRALLRSG